MDHKEELKDDIFRIFDESEAVHTMNRFLVVFILNERILNRDIEGD